MSTADSLRQTAGLLRPTESPVRSAETLGSIEGFLRATNGPLMLTSLRILDTGGEVLRQTKGSYRANRGSPRSFEVN